MKLRVLLRRCALPCLALPVLLSAAPNAGAYRNRDNPNPNDHAEGTYPVPYQRPTVEEIAALLAVVHGYIDGALPARVVSKDSGEPITDFSAVRADAVADTGDAGGFHPLGYPVGVLYAGMLAAGEATGDARYAKFVERHFEFIANRTPYFRAQAEKFGVPNNSFRSLLAPESLDDSGAIAAAMIKARVAGIGPELRPAIDGYTAFIAKKQFRLADGQLARQRPQKESVWADDAYMSIPALAQMSRLTRDRAWCDEAAKQLLGFAKYLFNQRTGLYTHGRNMNQPDNPEFYWARANGWVAMATVELLDVLPEDHVARPQILELMRAHFKALAQLQSGAGLWHQMLDKPDSYLETSASAMFVYAIARAINRGWISPVSYGSVAQAGWAGLVPTVDARGQIEGSCVGTTFASDHVYYYNRPTSKTHGHAYGPMLMAGAEMIRLLQNPKIEVKIQFRTYHYMPDE